MTVVARLGVQDSPGGHRAGSVWTIWPRPHLRTCLSVTALVGALIAAAAALLVTIVERLLLARDERRRWEVADKRRVYAEFLSACTEYTGGLLLTEVRDVDPWIPFRRTEMLALRRAELELVAPPDVGAAADELLQGVLEERKDPAGARVVRGLEKAFLEVARRDLGY